MDNEIFENQQIESSRLPHHEIINYESLEPKYLNTNIITTLIIWFIIMTIIIVVSFFADFIQENRWNILGAISLIFILILILEYFGFKFKGYALRQKDISYKRGLIWREITALPFNRVQHCEINEGPIDRMFGLASIKIFTAGGSSSDLEIPGLSKSNAELIKSFIIKKTAVDEEE